ncbi:hypothetical protein BJX66DRAFT_344396 [Aspergillus keveii]|uniref:2EXR domain-containing protein n=1 Tax=Aspergillus keveii TaxID=714993 RepID=A0ABR4FLE6_9EURO
MKRFPQFSRFPSELRRQIWQESCPLPGIHVFDVCIPSTSEESRLSRAFQTCGMSSEGTEVPSRILKYSATVFLDQFMPTGEDKCNNTGESSRLDFDPSAYRITSTVRQTCFEALESLRTRSFQIEIQSTITPQSTSPYRSASPKASNSVYLAAQNKWITYDNANDVLFLRFGGPVRIPAALLDEAEEESGEEQEYPRTFTSGISDVLLCPWSEEFTETLRDARRVALDLAELRTTADTSETEEGQWEEATAQDIAYLACCLQNELEVLYIIVDDPGSGERGSTLDIASLQMMGKAGNLLSSPGFEKRSTDIFYGKGVTYHEVFALERVGLGEGTGEFRVLRMLGDAVREQQGEEGVFRGVRALVCQRDCSECNL